MEIPAGYGQITWRFGGTNAPRGAVVTLGFDALVGADAAVLAQAAHEHWVTHLLPEQPDSLVLEETLVKLGPTATGPSAVYSDAQAGDVVAEAESPNVTLLVTKNTAQGGRQGKGRMFLPGVRSSVVNTSGELTGTYQADVQSAIDDLALDLIASGMTPVLLHADLSTPDDITSYTVQPLVATQRRRLRG